MTSVGERQKVTAQAERVASRMAGLAMRQPAQLQTLPQFQAQARSSELPHPLEANSAHPQSSHVGIVLRQFDIGRKQFQLPTLALLVEDFNHLQPARLRRVVQLAQITQGPLARTVGCADGFDQRPVAVVLAILVPMIRSQKHRGDGVTLSTPTARGLVYTTSPFQKAQGENKNVNQSPRPKIIKKRPSVTNLERAIRDKSRMRQFLTYGSVRGVPGNRHPYRDQKRWSALRWLRS